MRRVAFAFYSYILINVFLAPHGVVYARDLGSDLRTSRFDLTAQSNDVPTATRPARAQLFAQLAPSAAPPTEEADESPSAESDAIAPAVVTCDPRYADIKKQSRDETLQRDLVRTGLLEGEPGRISTVDFCVAVERLRMSTGAKTAGILQKDEIEFVRMTAQKLLDFAKFVRVTSDPANSKVPKRQLYVPSGLVSPAAVPGSEQERWPIYSSESSFIVRIHNPVHPVGSNTPLSMASLMLPDEADTKTVWRQFYYNHLTDDDFNIETMVRETTNATGYTEEFVNNSAGWRLGDKTHGLKLTANLDPNLPIIKQAPVLPSEKRASLPEGKERDIDNWKRVIKAVWNELIILYKQENAWLNARVDSQCRSSTDKAADGKWIAIVYATGRQQNASFAAAALDQRIRLESNEYFESDPGKTLNVGCAYVWVPAALRFDSEPYDHVGYGPAGGRSNMRAKHIDTELQKIVDKFDVNSGAELQLRDPLLRESTRALLYVHGYNNSFADALIRVAQLAYAIDYKGRLYLFSWPGRDSQVSYAPSMDRAEQAEIELRTFLKMILGGTRQIEFDVIAHSMGSQILIRALGSGLSAFHVREGSDRRDRVRLGHVIFAAPDVNNDVFRRKIHEFLGFTTSVTVFASGCDGVILLSKLGRGFEPRAGGLTGSVPIDLLIYDDKVQVIDITHASGGSWCWRNLQSYIGANHSAFAFDKTVVEQISGILRHYRKVLTPPQRLGKNGKNGAIFAECGYPNGAGGGKGRYWVLTDDASKARACTYPAANAPH